MKRSTKSRLAGLALPLCGTLLLLQAACGGGYAGHRSSESEAAGGDAGTAMPGDEEPAVMQLNDLDDDDRKRESARTEDGTPIDMFFKNYGVNPFVDTEDDHLSTFAVDVDSGSYTLCRSYLNEGRLPPEKAVRTEEFVNYFDYGYEAPMAEPFAVTMDCAPSRFGQDLKNAHLLRIGIKAREVDPLQRKRAVLTFVIDVSGSMDYENRLGNVKQALRMLVDQLREGDKVGIAVYGSRGKRLLEHVDVHRKKEILAAIDDLTSEGSTYAEEGIRIAYDMASEAYSEGAINRIVLCSDGVGNVGQTDPKKILEMVEEQRRKGITLSAIGFGMGNYNDVMMEQLGDKGDGHYAYVDTLDEAKRIFVDNLTGTLQVVARNVKVQVDFNPEVVKSYRLIGYENRDVADEDFRNDFVDGGEIGSGHSCTALYEIKLHEGVRGRLATTTVRYRQDEHEEYQEVATDFMSFDVKASWGEAALGLRLAGTVAEFAEVLRGSYWAKNGSSEEVLGDLRKLVGETDHAAVAELVGLAAKADKLQGSREHKPVAGSE